MKRWAYATLVMSALYELVRHDAIQRVFGFRRIQADLKTGRIRQREAQMSELEVCEAIRLAMCLYWKPVLCLQKSACMVRLLRAHGIAGRLVIGYRAAPFLSHAWVEVEGRVVNDSPLYPQRLKILLVA